MTLATHKGRPKPEAAETATAMGVMSVMVPSRRSHGKRHEAADHERHRHCELRGDHGKQQVGDAFRAVAPDGSHEDARRHEDEDHGHDGLVADAAPHDGQLLVEGELAVLHARHQKRHQEYHHDGNVVEPHGYAHDVLEQHAQSQVEHQKHPDGQKRRHVALGCVARRGGASALAAGGPFVLRLHGIPSLPTNVPIVSLEAGSRAFNRRREKGRSPERLLPVRRVRAMRAFSKAMGRGRGRLRHRVGFSVA